MRCWSLLQVIFLGTENLARERSTALVAVPVNAYYYYYYYLTYMSAPSERSRGHYAHPALYVCTAMHVLFIIGCTPYCSLITK